MHFPDFFARAQSPRPPAELPPARLAKREAIEPARSAPDSPAQGAARGSAPRMNRAGEPMERLGAESPLGITSPRGLMEEGGRPRAFSGLSDTPPEAPPTSPRAPLESAHPRGGAMAGAAATLMPQARVAARTGMTGFGLAAGGLNGGAMVGVLGALPPVEPISFALSAAASASDAAAAYGAHRRGGKLREVQRNAMDYACDHPGPDHDRLVREVLPYAIDQQDKRMMRKGRAAVPFVGALGEGIRGVWTHFRKKRAGTLGVDREAASNHLARHLTPHHCGLAEDMTEALFGRRRMEALRGMDPDEASQAIMTRLKTN